VSTGRIIAVIIGALLALVGLGATVAGIGMVAVHVAQGDDGYYRTPTERFETSTAAFVAYANLRGGGQGGDHPIDEVRVRATAADQDPIFVGIGPRDEVEAWLAGVAHERVTSVRYVPLEVGTERSPGTRESTPPDQEEFWVASTSGSGTQTLTWQSQRGDWALVVMNADGQPGVTADVDAGVAGRWLLPAGIIVGAVGLLLLAGGVVIMVVAVTVGRGRTGSEAPPP
jgi:hypothetical protein